jgi:hypothetical protein
MPHTACKAQAIYCTPAPDLALIGYPAGDARNFSESPGCDGIFWPRIQLNEVADAYTCVTHGFRAPANRNLELCLAAPETNLMETSCEAAAERE